MMVFSQIGRWPSRRQISFAAMLALAGLAGFGLPSPGQTTSTPQRIAPAPEYPDDPILAKMFASIRERGSEPLNMHRTLGIAPPIFQAYAGMAFALRDKALVPRRDRELIIYRTVQLANGDYEEQQHRPMAISCGLSPAQLDEIGAWQASKLFDDKDRSLLAYADAVASERGVDDAVFGNLRRWYSDRDIVELTITAAFYAAASRVTKALSVPLEGARQGVESAYGKC